MMNLIIPPAGQPLFNEVILKGSDAVDGAQWLPVFYPDMTGSLHYFCSDGSKNYSLVDKDGNKIWGKNDYYQSGEATGTSLCACTYGDAIYVLTLANIGGQLKTLLFKVSVVDGSVIWARTCDFGSGIAIDNYQSKSYMVADANGIYIVGSMTSTTNRIAHIYFTTDGTHQWSVSTSTAHTNTIDSIRGLCLSDNFCHCDYIVNTEGNFLVSLARLSGGNTGSSRPDLGGDVFGMSCYNNEIYYLLRTPYAATTTPGVHVYSVNDMGNISRQRYWNVPTSAIVMADGLGIAVNEHGVCIAWHSAEEPSETFTGADIACLTHDLTTVLWDYRLFKTSTDLTVARTQGGIYPIPLGFMATFRQDDGVTDDLVAVTFRGRDGSNAVSSNPSQSRAVGAALSTTTLSTNVPPSPPTKSVATLTNTIVSITPAVDNTSPTTITTSW